MVGSSSSGGGRGYGRQTRHGAQTRHGEMEDIEEEGAGVGVGGVQLGYTGMLLPPPLTQQWSCRNMCRCRCNHASNPPATPTAAATDGVHAQPPSANFRTGCSIFEFRLFAGMFFCSFFVFRSRSDHILFFFSFFFLCVNYRQGMRKDSLVVLRLRPQ